MGPNYGEMVFRWFPFRIISDNPTCQRRWWPLLKIAKEKTASKSDKK
jgi:hypothetical protein